MIKKIFLIFLLFLLFLSLTGMAWRLLTPPSIPTIIKGKITDLNTGIPLTQVKIEIFTLKQKVVIWSLTNSLGEYQIKVLIPSGYYFLKISKNGYITRTALRFFQQGKTCIFNFALRSIPVHNLPPKIIEIQPKDNNLFLAGANIKIQVSASDPDNDPLEYQFSIGGTIKQGWSSLNTYSWQTTDSDTGTVSVTCEVEVRDNKGGRDTKTITYNIINPTVKEILQRVADNYAKIYDFKADMILSSTLNGQPFGETEYCRYYFKAPNKEKTESFTDSNRTTKTEVIIIDSSIMYLIDTVNRITQQVDLLTEAGISSSQFNQMDIYYNLTNFLNNHTVTRNNAKTDFNNMIIAIDAIPRAQNNLYSKLELYIDYNKGLLLKSCLYKENESWQMELLQTIEVKESQRMSNGAWFPKKMNKTPVLRSGNLIETANYTNLQINVGLTDLDFDPDQQ